MKILANVDCKNLICEVNANELGKVFDKYALFINDLSKAIDTNLIPGDEIDLGKGYDFRNDIVGACKDMMNAYGKFTAASETLIKFAEMVSRTSKETKEK